MNMKCQRKNDLRVQRLNRRPLYVKASVTMVTPVTSQNYPITHNNFFRPCSPSIFLLVRFVGQLYHNSAGRVTPSLDLKADKEATNLAGRDKDEITRPRDHSNAFPGFPLSQRRMGIGTDACWEVGRGMGRWKSLGEGERGIGRGEGQGFGLDC